MFLMSLKQNLKLLSEVRLCFFFIVQKERVPKYLNFPQLTPEGVPKYQNCPQLTPERVPKYQNCPQLMPEGVPQKTKTSKVNPTKCVINFCNLPRCPRNTQALTTENVRLFKRV